MELYASGFNAHGQLLPPTLPHDLPHFQKIASGTTIRVLCATWSFTILAIDGVLQLRGSCPHPDPHPAAVVLEGLPADEIKTIVGDAGGVLCALTTEGELWVLEEERRRTSGAAAATGSTASLSWVRHDLDLRAIKAAGGVPGEEGGRVTIDQIVVAGNDRVCISIYTHLLTFPSLTSLLSGCPHIIATSSLPTLPSFLLASSGVFHALCSSVCYTWGDGRYASLGRLGPTAVPAPALEQSVSKIAAGGWLAAAVTRDGGCYVWGGRLGERERGIGGEEEEEEGGKRFVDVEGGGADVVDVAVGHGWVVVLTATGRVWGWGDGRWGQLGVKGDESGWVEGWVELGGWEGEGREVVGVACGAWNSFVLTRKV